MLQQVSISIKCCSFKLLLIYTYLTIAYLITSNDDENSLEGTEPLEGIIYI